MAIKRKNSVERARKKAAWVFLLPWLLGLVCFFAVPIIYSVIYSLSDVAISTEKIGLTISFKGIFNYNYLFFRDAEFMVTVGDSIAELLYTVPVIFIFSIFVALLLNQKFKGRGLVRSVFFLPVIIASGVVMKIINGDVFVQNNMSGSSATFQTDAISEILLRAGIPQNISKIVTQVTGGVFDLSWKSGIQILLFISALQSISPSYYEAASVEGANAWESFWKITFPLISPTSLLVIIYSIIDSFTDVSNGVMKSMMERFNHFYYGIASASAIIYTLAILIIIGIVMFIFRKSIFHNS